MNRRSFLKTVAAGTGAIIAAPWVVNAGSLMPIVDRRWIARESGLLVRMGDLVETVERTGGIGGPEVTAYTYSASFDTALVGHVGHNWRDSITRVWMDGREVPLSTIEVVREEGQLIGKARDLPLTEYGNRIPQVEFEVIRRG